MPQQEARAYRHSTSCKYPIDLSLFINTYLSSRWKAMQSNSQVNASPFSFSDNFRKLISWRMRSPTFRMILPILWRRRRGWSSFWLPISPSAKSPQSWTQTSLWSPSLLPSPASPLGCLPQHRPPSPQSLQGSQHSPQPPTPSSPAAASAAAPSCPLPPSPTARSSWRIWTPQSWRNLWTWWQRPRWRRRGRCPRSTCPTLCTRCRTGSRFTTRPILATLSPCARPWWPAPLPAPPTPLHLCSASLRRRPSPLVASPTGEEAAAMTSPPTPSAHPPCWPSKDFQKQ